MSIVLPGNYKQYAIAACWKQITHISSFNASLSMRWRSTSVTSSYLRYFRESPECMLWKLRNVSRRFSFWIYASLFTMHNANRCCACGQYLRWSKMLLFLKYKLLVRNSESISIGTSLLLLLILTMLTSSTSTLLPASDDRNSSSFTMFVSMFTLGIHLFQIYSRWHELAIQYD